ncbi:basic leucine zipper transcription factor [Lithospermum erythrorhizon]|uniref:Basic leucine zipper transcription factor n=1 Tax=Lithospermum erythrorhizon TaxID=34254 RepID=A0AAV3NIE8_LITER
MGSFINFKNFGDTMEAEDGDRKPTGSLPLARQSSIYSLTFDELQNTFGGPGKDFGSMNMEDLLKNIWTAEESQALAASSGFGVGTIPGGNLQRQGSLTLPRTLSQKTVDEVLRDMFKENNSDTKDLIVGGSSLGPRQPTLGEMTLEDFLQRAGVVSEDMQQTISPNVGGIFGGLAQPCNDTSGLTIGFQQSSQNQRLLGNQFIENSNEVTNSSNMMLNLGGVGTYHQQPHQQAQSQEQPMFPKQATVAFSSGAWLGNNPQMDSPGAKVPVVGVSSSSVNSATVQGGFRHSPGAKVPVVGMSNSSIMSSTIVQGGVMQRGATGLGGLNNMPTSIAPKSPGNHLTSVVAAKSNMDTLSVSPSPFACAEGGQGRRPGSSLEKVVERRRKRMIKNRESAARSRARKQAYTLELEAEITKLKEINQELLKKQAELMEMQKNQTSETVKMPWGGKKIYLRRTLTGPW